MEVFPIFDYSAQTLLGIVVLCIVFGLLVPIRTVRQLLQRIAYLESALDKSQEALKEEQRTGAVVRHFFEGLDVR